MERKGQILQVLRQFSAYIGLLFTKCLGRIIPAGAIATLEGIEALFFESLIRQDQLVCSEISKVFKKVT